MNKFILRIIYLTIGIIFIAYNIFVRILLQRIPRKLYFLDPLDYRLILTMSVWIIISIIMLYNCKKILNHSYNHKNNPFTVIAAQIGLLLYEALFQVYFTFMTFIPNNYDKLSSISKQFYTFFGHRRETILPFILYSIRIIIVLSFLFDVLVLFQLKYFYKSLSLFCISIVIQIGIFILRDFSNNLDDIKSSLIVDATINDQGETIFTYRPSINNENIDLLYHVNQLILCQKLQGYLEIYDNINTHFNPRINLVVYSCYLYGWSYILYQNLSSYIDFIPTIMP